MAKEDWLIGSVVGAPVLADTTGDDGLAVRLLEDTKAGLVVGAVVPELEMDGLERAATSSPSRW